MRSLVGIFVVRCNSQFLVKRAFYLGATYDCIFERYICIQQIEEPENAHETVCYYSEAILRLISVNNLK